MLGRRYSRKRRIQEAVAGIVLFDKERLIRDIVLFYLLEARDGDCGWPLSKCSAVCKSFRAAVSNSWQLLHGLDLNPQMALDDVRAALGRMGGGLKRLTFGRLFQRAQLMQDSLLNGLSTQRSIISGPLSWTVELSTEFNNLSTRGVQLEELDISFLPREDDWLALQGFFDSLSGIAGELQQLNASSCRLHVETGQGLLLAELLKANPSLRVLDVSGNQLQGADALLHLKNLEELCFYGNVLQDAHLITMSALELSSLQTLRAGGPNKCEVDFEVLDLMHGMQWPDVDWPNCMLLYINRNGVSPNRGRAGLTALCKKLGDHGVLKHLDMTALFSYDRLFKGCFAGLHLLKMLETLDLSWNALFDEVILFDPPSLTLYSPKFSPLKSVLPVGATPVLTNIFANVLNAHVSGLSFSTTYLPILGRVSPARLPSPTSSPHSASLVCGVCSQPRLLALMVFQMQGCEDLCQCLLMSQEVGLLPALRNLSLRSCRIGSVGLSTHLAPVLSQLGSLRSLDLGGNHLADAGAIALSHVLQHALTGLTKATNEQTIFFYLKKNYTVREYDTSQLSEEFQRFVSKGTTNHHTPHIFYCPPRAINWR